MNRQTREDLHSQADPYATRLPDGERWIERADPVVWTGSQPEGDHAPLSADDVASYERNGYLVQRDLFTPDEVSALVQAATELREAPKGALGDDAVYEPGAEELRTLFRLETHHALFDLLARSQRVAGVARQLLADDIYIHQSRLNYKPGFTGKEFYWHSDFETWHAEDGMPRMRALSASILLTDNDALNGPLMLMPGSQRVFIGCQGETPQDNHKTSLRKQEIGTPSQDSLCRLSDRFGIDHVAGPAGTVIFFDCNTMHGSNGNITPNPRSNAFFVFNAVSNRLTAPFAAVRPRPPFLARRKGCEPLALHRQPLSASA